MPLLRYFAYVGCALLALLFAVNWTLQPLSAEPERASADRSTIRIHSQQRWPSAVVYDTTLPTIVPPTPVIAVASGAAKASGVTEASAAARPARDAFALATEGVKPAETVKPAKPHAQRARVVRAPAQPLYQPFGFRTTWAAGW